MCERAGMAVVLRPDEFSARAIAEGVSAVLRDPRFLEAAQLTADEIVTMADPSEVAGIVRAYSR
jgi:UDP:flavonoid glycosyltransferase YjiC (YdhE family)